MAVPTNKDELLKAIDSNFNKLIKELRGVPLSVVNEHSLDGHAKGTQMSVANLTA
ncbi:ClbS/DfsB family four-helix bundle protein, partial [Serratia grimesii]